MDEREHARALPDDRHPPPAHVRGRRAVLAVVGARRRRRSRSGARRPQAPRRPGPSPPSPAGPGRRRRTARARLHERVLLGLHPRALGPVGERDALATRRRTPAARAASSRFACPRCGRGSWAHRRPACEVEPVGERGQLVNETSGAASPIAAVSRSRSKTSTTAALAPACPIALRALLRARHAGHLVAGRDQLRDEAAPITPLAPGHEHPHRTASRSRVEHPAEQHRGEQERHEVRGAEPARLGVADVDQVVQRVEAVLDEREREHRHAPALARHGRERDRAEREVEGGDVPPCSGRSAADTGRSRRRRSRASARAAGRGPAGRRRRRSGVGA